MKLGGRPIAFASASRPSSAYSISEASAVRMTPYRSRVSASGSTMRARLAGVTVMVSSHCRTRASTRTILDRPSNLGVQHDPSQQKRVPFALAAHAIRPTARATHSCPQEKPVATILYLPESKARADRSQRLAATRSQLQEELHTASIRTAHDA